MDNPPNGVSHIAPPLKRLAVILKLIDTVLADREPQLAQLRTPVEPTTAPCSPGSTFATGRPPSCSPTTTRSSSPHPWHCPLPFPPAVAGPVEP
jgi:hypothetical protein